MIERAPKPLRLVGETTLPSGVIVPGELSDTTIRPKLSVVPDIDRAVDRATSEKEHQQAYEDIIDPKHVIELKDAIDTATKQLSEEEKITLRQKYIDAYLQTGSHDGDRPIPDSLREDLDVMLTFSYEELEAELPTTKNKIFEPTSDVAPSEELPNTEKRDAKEVFPDVEKLSRMIDAADEIADPDKRVAELTRLVEKCVQWDNIDDSLGFSDMALVASWRIRYPQKRGFKGRFKDIKSIGIKPKNMPNNAYRTRSQAADAAFEITAKRTDNYDVSIDAANQIYNKNDRNRVLQAIAEEAFEEGDEYIGEAALDFIGHRHSADPQDIDALHEHGELMSIDTEGELARKGLRAYMDRRKQNKARYEIAVKLKDEDLASSIRDKKLRRKALDEIARRQHL